MDAMLCAGATTEQLKQDGDSNVMMMLETLNTPPNDFGRP